MRPEKEYLLAIDVGSTTVRCVLFDLQGRPAGEAYCEPAVHHPQPTWAEVEPEDWWMGVVEATGEALQRSGVPGERILGIGLCGLKHAMVPIDAHGRPLARAMLWMDQRCQPQVEWMSREHGDVLAEVLGEGGGMSTTPSAPKLRWIIENEPDLLRRTERFLLAKDFIRLRLTGTVATDPSDAGGTCLYDRRSKSWSPRMLEVVGVPADKLPPILDSTAVAGRVTGQAARATGLAAGTPVVVGGGDVQCTLIGANASHTWRACLYLGTAAWLSAGRDASTARFGATATTGAALKWLVDLFDLAGSGSPFASYAALLEEAGGVPLGARGLIFLPHLMGERGPRYDAQARGVLFGLTLAHRRDDVARAVLEGCAFQLRRIAEALAPQAPSWRLGGSDLPPRTPSWRLGGSDLPPRAPSWRPWRLGGSDLPGGGLEGMVAVGGGARSALWLQIIADVIGIPLLVPRVVEAGALGAAILAGVGVGVYPGVQEAAAELVQIAHRIEPDEARHERYGEVYARFLELEERVSPLYGGVQGS